MTRQIKFRVWTGAKMEYNIMAGFLGAFYVAGIDPADTASMSPANTKFHSELNPLMQFTGLLDKNGKEIFEGDIYRIWDLFGKHLLGGGTPWKENRQVVEWDEQNGDAGFFLNGSASELLEVLGNIYENSDLLK